MRILIILCYAKLKKKISESTKYTSTLTVYEHYIQSNTDKNVLTIDRSAKINRMLASCGCNFPDNNDGNILSASGASGRNLRRCVED